MYTATSHVGNIPKSKKELQKGIPKKVIPSFSESGMGNMVSKELLRNEEEGKEMPFFGSQKKGTKKGNTQPSLQGLSLVTVYP